MVDLSKGWFEVENKNGNVVRHEILFWFDSEIDDNTYIVHTANEKDENGNVIVYASYINEAVHGKKLMNVDNDVAFGVVEGMLIKQTGTVRGYTDESSFS